MSREKLIIEVAYLVLAGIILGVGVKQLFEGEIAIALACSSVGRMYLLKLEIMEKK